jgi:hypothetical protein
MSFCNHWCCNNKKLGNGRLHHDMVHFLLKVWRDNLYIWRTHKQICKIWSCGMSKKKWSPSSSLGVHVYIIFVMESIKIELVNFCGMIQAWDNSTQLLQPINMYEFTITQAACMWQILWKKAVHVYSMWANLLDFWNLKFNTMPTGCPFN